MHHDEDAGSAASARRDGATKGTALAPSHHLRPLTSLALLLSVTLGLSACGAIQQSGAAAIVNGTAISDQDLQTVVKQINSVAPEGQKAPTNDLLVKMIVARFVLAEADRAHKTISDADARKTFPDLPNPAPPTMKLFRMQGLVAQLDQASRDAIGKEIDKAKITINPRYGTYDATKGIVPNSPNWLKPSPTPQPSATPN
jgi:hypothetical protein